MDSIGEVAAVVTVAGILVYVVGLVGLAIAIRLRLVRDFSTAWFVVALLPRTIVAGQGVRIWLMWPIPFALLLVLVDMLIENLTSSHERAVAILDTSTAFLGLGYLSLFLVLVLYAMGKTDRENPELIGHVIIAIIVAALGIFLIAQGASIVLRSQGAFVVIRVVGEGMLNLDLGPPVQDMLSGTMLFLFGGFLVGVPAAATIDHPLPLVKVAGDSTVLANGLIASPPKPLYMAPQRNLSEWIASPLYMVAHVDGTWHFLDDKEDVLLCIPDRLLLGIQTIKKQPKRKPPKSKDPHSKWARTWKQLSKHFQK
jgi:hypothetical protein